MSLLTSCLLRAQLQNDPVGNSKWNRKLFIKKWIVSIAPKTTGHITFWLGGPTEWVSSLSDTKRWEAYFKPLFVSDLTVAFSQVEKCLVVTGKPEQTVQVTKVAIRDWCRQFQSRHLREVFDDHAG